MPQVIRKTEIQLGNELGSIYFGESRTDIIARLGEPNLSRLRSTDFNRTDFYDAYDLKIDYGKETNFCVAVEFDSTELMVENINLFALSWPQFLDWVQAQDPNVDVQPGELLSKTLGISAVAKTGEPSRVETICFFSQGYWPSDEEMDAAIAQIDTEMLYQKKASLKLETDDYAATFNKN
jgi:hypothetical protein